MGKTYGKLDLIIWINLMLTKKLQLVESLIKISDNIIYTINFASTFNTTCNNT